MTLTTTYAYDVAGDFTFDATLVEIAAGKARLKDLRPTAATFYAALSTLIAANWAGPTGAAIGAGAISGGHLDGNSTSAKGAKWTVSQSGQVGTARFTVIPQYSGTPAGKRSYYVERTGSGQIARLMWFYHESDGNIYCDIYDNSATKLVALAFAFNPVSGTSYEFEVDFDFTGGTHRIFQNGVLKNTQTATGTRGTITEIGLGTAYDDGAGGAAYFTNIVHFSAVQHTATYTPAAAPSATIYSVADPTIYPVSTLAMDSLHAFTATIDAAGSDLVKFHLSVNGTPKYWNGTAWVTSTGSYAQSNTAAEVNTNASALDLSDGSSVYPVAVLHSADGTTTPDVDTLAVTYRYFASSPTGPAYCLVYAYIVDAGGTPVSGAKLIATGPTTHFNAGGLFVAPVRVEATSNDDGYVAMELADTTTYSKKVTFSYQMPGSSEKRIGDAAVPNAASVNLASLTFAAA